MNKGKLLAFLFLTSVALVAIAATSKTIVEDTGVTACVSTDIVPAVIDPGGTPLSRKLTLAQIFNATRTNSTFKGSTTVDALTTATLTNSGDYFGVAATLSGDLTLSGGTASRFVVTSSGKAAAYSAASSVLAATLTDETGSGAAVFATAPSVTSLTADAITVSGLTASRLVATDGSKALASAITSANLASSISDESGSGLAVFSGSPTVTNATMAGSLTLTQATGVTTSDATNHVISFATASQVLITATNDVNVIPTNTAAGTQLTVLIDANGADRVVSVPATIRTLGLTNSQATLPDGSIGKLTITGYGSNITNCIARYEAFAF